MRLPLVPPSELGAEQRPAYCFVSVTLDGFDVGVPEGA